MREGVHPLRQAQPVAAVGKVPMAAIGNTEHRNYNATLGRPQITVETCKWGADI